MRKLSIIISTVFLAFIALIIFINIKTSDTIISKQFNEDTIIKSATVTKYAPSEDGNRFDAKIAEGSTEDVELIKEMVENFSGLWLRREANPTDRWLGEYSISVQVSNEKSPGVLKTDSLYINFDDSNRIIISSENSGHYYVLNSHDYYEKMENIIGNLELE
ncbi:hypothetical protein [Sutcliffiella deserti]|uniref:hypothetical protein n=1 Tax=Sutcliffiella deserti TaxID=2875501 RepID=UPI001CC053D2|nr:hypothetical protein [Sutcliffiella deserti]